MKKVLYALAIIAFSLAVAQAMAAPMPQAGTSAPSFTLPSQDGTDVALTDYRGKWVVLYFYPKDFTKGCSLEAHAFQADLPKYQAKNAVILGVGADSVDSHKSFCTKQGLDFKLLSDTKHTVSEQYGSVTRHGNETLSARNTFLIDPTGAIRKVYAGVNPAGHSTQVIADLDGLESAGKH